MSSRKEPDRHLRRRASAIFHLVAIGVYLALSMGVARAQDAPPSLAQTAAAEAAASQIGLSADDVAKLKSDYASGHFSSEQLQDLCKRLAAQHYSATEIDAMANSLGVDSGTRDQIKQCAGGQAIAAGNGNAGGNSGQAKAGTGKTQVSQSQSAIEDNFRSLAVPGAVPLTPTPSNLVQFGYSLFSSPVSTFAPVSNVPVGDEYLIGPGDVLDVLLWGRINSTLHLQVNRDGAVSMQQVGPIQVAGLNFRQAKDLIEQRAGQMTGVQVAVTMGQLRTIQVFVIGEVEQPGVYTISSLSRVSNALVSAGGINKVGSLRNIELRRGNRVVRVIDLYDFLLRGSTSSDLRLEPQDVIFVPVIGKVAAVAGDVKRPAIYELPKRGESLRGLLGMAGGISAFGYAHRIQVETIQNHQRRIALDVDTAGLAAGHFEVHDGDLVKVYSVLPKQRNVVTLKGNVNRPGVYQWQPGMRVSDLIREAEGLADHTFFKYALISRLQGASRAPHLIPVDLGAALSDHLETDANVPLQPRDEFRIYRDSEMHDRPQVKVVGAVRSPGLYPLNLGMRVRDLIYLSGGLKEGAYLKRAELARSQVVNGTATKHLIISVDLQAALSGSDADQLLQANDTLVILEAAGWHLPWVVKVEGQVLRPGSYSIYQDERLDDLLKRCGGLLPDAYLQGAVFVRTSVKEMEQKRLDESRRRLQKKVAEMRLAAQNLGAISAQNAQSQTAGQAHETLEYLQRVLDETQGQDATGRVVMHLVALDDLSRSPENIALEDGDTLTIPRRPASVNILGQVYNPTSIVYESKLTTQDYLWGAGGPTPGADADNIYVIKADGSVLSEDGVKHSRKARTFPLLPVMSGGLMVTHLAPGDTVYVPEKMILTNKLQIAKDVATVIGQSMMAIGMVGLLAVR